MNNPKPSGAEKPKSIVRSFYRAFKSLGTAIPMLLGIVLLLGLFLTCVSTQFIASVFTGALFRDTVIGAAIGSIAAGNPITSYIIGGELMKEGVSLFAITAFILTWVTVSIVQFPAEAAFLGKRFAVIRNSLGFILAILVSIAAVTTLMVVK
ncbi:hypothetical protein C5S31_10270 [ANME-1 cluster archaeon GoMg2]|nr:hypothetical protein [ANME-1 cluster archaeon GoMg2]